MDLEKYQPSPEEMGKAEEMMTDEQKKMSETRIGESKPSEFYKTQSECYKKQAEDYFEKVLKERFPYMNYERGQESYLLVNLKPEQRSEYDKLLRLSEDAYDNFLTIRREERQTE